MTRRYRIETYSGNTLIIQADEVDKNIVKVKLLDTGQEIRIKILKTTEDSALIEIDNEVYKVHLSENGVFINDENALINNIIELLPIGLKKEYIESGKTPTTYRPGEIRAPLSGKINDVKVKPGDKVQPGDVVVLMESMKMITEVKSDVEGVVEEVYVKPGDAVNKDALLVKIRLEEQLGKQMKSEK